jgi:hypothetical protein
LAENDQGREARPNGDESADQDSDDSLSSSGGSTVVAFAHVSFPKLTAISRLEHQDGLRSEIRTKISLPTESRISDIFVSPLRVGGSDLLADSLNDDDNDTGFTAGNLNDEHWVMGDDDEEADVRMTLKLKGGRRRWRRGMEIRL